MLKNIAYSILTDIRIYLPGQSCNTHWSVWVPSPWHCFPLYRGGGLLHARRLFLVPEPQVTPQGVQSPHSDHWPSSLKHNTIKTLFALRYRNLENPKQHTRTWYQAARLHHSVAATAIPASITRTGLRAWPVPSPVPSSTTSWTSGPGSPVCPVTIHLT